jgi:ATP-dependent DNA helicase PIF1
MEDPISYISPPEASEKETKSTTLYYKDLLNPGQREAYDAVLKGQTIFITGPGGTGKSFLMNSLFEDIPRLTGKKIALTALTGCAALLLHSRAKTLHSWSGIGLGNDVVPLLVKQVLKSRKASLRWIETDVLVIDEVSMLTPELFEKIDQVGRKIRRNDRQPFGGLQLVLVGDFFQLPPVTKGKEDGEETIFLFESPLWKTLSPITYELTEIVRQKDPVFQKVLNEARAGTISKKSLKVLASRFGIDYKKELIQPTMVFTKRAEVDDINTSYLKKLTTERKIYKATTLLLPLACTRDLKLDDPFLQKAITKADYNGPYSSELVLAIGAQVMLIKNNTELGLVNGSRGVVTGYTLGEDAVVPLNKEPDPSLLVPVVRFKNGVQIPIEYSQWEVPEFKGVMRRQIPLRLGYAITVHKSQGSTLDCALIDVGSNTFEYGQAYVALSRVKDLDSLYIHDLEATAFKAHPKVIDFYSSLSVSGACSDKSDDPLSNQ